MSSNNFPLYMEPNAPPSTKTTPLYLIPLNNFLKKEYKSEIDQNPNSIHDENESNYDDYKSNGFYYDSIELYEMKNIIFTEDCD